MDFPYTISRVENSPYSFVKVIVMASMLGISAWLMHSWQSVASTPRFINAELVRSDIAALSQIAVSLSPKVMLSRLRLPAISSVPDESVSPAAQLINTQALSALKPSNAAATVASTPDAKLALAKPDQKPQIQLVYTSAVIQHSLARTVKRVGMQSKISRELTNIFHDEIDLGHLRSGDRFNVLYERPHIGDKVLGTGDIVAAEFVSGGKTFRAVRYVDSSGHLEYYTPEGLSLHKGFLRSPVKYSYISSGFDLHRFDPVMHRVHAHPAVDFAAPSGTPIQATGDGRVSYVGPRFGYGNIVVIQHPNRLVTMYAHMSHYAKGMHAGTSVHEGQTIGYVGTTGMVTGPHVHYEVSRDGVRYNPLTLPLPTAAPISRQARSRFVQQARQWLAQLEINQDIRLASNADLKLHGA